MTIALWIVVGLGLVYWGLVKIAKKMFGE